MRAAAALLAGHVWAYDFVQDRTSDGRPFRMLKFRTMVDGADKLQANLADGDEGAHRRRREA